MLKLLIISTVLVAGGIAAIWGTIGEHHGEKADVSDPGVKASDTASVSSGTQSSEGEVSEKDDDDDSGKGEIGEKDDDDDDDSGEVGEADDDDDSGEIGEKDDDEDDDTGEADDDD